MTDRPVLEINEGRHLIQEQLVNTYVTNDTLLQGGYQDDGDSGLNSMVCILLVPEVFGANIVDDRDWGEWLWEIGLRETSRVDRFYGSDWEFRTRYQRYYRDRRQE